MTNFQKWNRKVLKFLKLFTTIFLFIYFNDNEPTTKMFLVCIVCKTKINSASLAVFFNRKWARKYLASVVPIRNFYLAKHILFFNWKNHQTVKSDSVQRRQPQSVSEQINQKNYILKTSLKIWKILNNLAKHKTHNNARSCKKGGPSKLKIQDETVILWNCHQHKF